MLHIVTSEELTDGLDNTRMKAIQHFVDVIILTPASFIQIRISFRISTVDTVTALLD